METIASNMTSRTINKTELRHFDFEDVRLEVQSEVHGILPKIANHNVLAPVHSTSTPLNVFF